MNKFEINGKVLSEGENIWDNRHRRYRWILLAFQGSCGNDNELSVSKQYGKFPDELNDYQFLKKDFTPWI
jgi:hypothetical protein